MSADVLVLGSFMMDLSIRAPRRPGPGETVVGDSFEEFLGGKGCNQALAAARAGATTAMVGRVGDDAYGRRFLERLALDGVDATHVVVDEVAGTGIGAPLVEASGDNSIVIIPRANHRVSGADVLEARAAVEGARVLLLQLELPAEAVEAAARLAHAAGVTVVLNPAPALGDLAALEGLVDVLVPNEGEASTLSGCTDPRAAARVLRDRFGCAVVVTLGEEGSLVLGPDAAEPTVVPTHVVDAVDTVGAGDTFCGNLGARLAAGDDLVAAARFASAAAALSVTVPGAEPSLPTADAVRGLLAAAPELAS